MRTNAQFAILNLAHASLTTCVTGIALAFLIKHSSAFKTMVEENFYYLLFFYYLFGLSTKPNIAY